MSTPADSQPNAQVKLWSAGPFFEGLWCDAFTHYFDDVPGRCRCGESEWEPQQRPKLRVVE